LIYLVRVIIRIRGTLCTVQTVVARMLSVALAAPVSSIASRWTSRPHVLRKVFATSWIVHLCLDPHRNGG
jgi:hypothetical protein